MDGPFFQICWKKKLFSKYFENIPLAPPPAAPSGRHRARRRGYFFKYLENRPLFSKYLEKRPIHIFLNDTFHFFQITIIYKGTQVTRLGLAVCERAKNQHSRISRYPHLLKTATHTPLPMISMYFFIKRRFKRLVSTVTSRDQRNNKPWKPRGGSLSNLNKLLSCKTNN